MTETRQESLVDKSVNNQHGIVSLNCNCKSTLHLLILEGQGEKRSRTEPRSLPSKNG